MAETMEEIEGATRAGMTIVAINVGAVEIGIGMKTAVT